MFPYGSVNVVGGGHDAITDDPPHKPLAGDCTNAISVVCGS